MVTAIPLFLAALVVAEPPVGSGTSAKQPAASGQEEEFDPAAVSPVQLIPKIELRHEFVQPTHAGSVNTTTFQMDVQFLRRALVRFELPLPRLAVGDAQISGVGDIRLQALTLLTAGPGQVSVLITGLVLDTASRPQLGSGKQQVFFGGAVALKPVRWWLPYLVVEEQISFGGKEARPDVNQLVARLGNIVFGNQGNWLKLDLDTTVDFEDDRGRFFATLEAGALVVGSVALFVRGGSQLIGQRQLDYRLAAGVRYLFKLGQ
jgi:hypothetical protein